MSASGSANVGRGGNSNHRNGEGGGGGRDVKGKGRARGGGGGRGRGGVRRAADYTPAQEPRVAQEAIAEASRVAIEKAQREREQEAAALGVDGEEEEVDTCYICAEPIKYYALGTCSHRTCHVCSLRLRALYKKRECTFCKTDLPSVITTLDSSTPFEDFPPDAFPYSDARLAIAFETSQMMEDTLALLRFNCPQLNCDYLGTGWADLKKHARNDHGLVFCDLCTKHKKIFTHEHTLYTPEQLKSHIRDGDPQPTGAEDDDERTGFTGHPSCEFCRITFYDNDQLFTHCRDKHEQCFLCIQNGTGRYQYYVDYPHLETHFQAAHYLCLNPQCLKDRFVVFDNQIDLQAHQVSVHGEAVPKTARRLETNFSYAPASRDPRAGGGVSMAPKQNAGHNTNHAGASSSSAAVPSSSNHTEAPTPAQSSSTSNGRNRIIPGLQRGGFKTNLSEPESSRKNDKKSAQTSTMGDSITGVKQNDPLMASRHSSLLSRFSDAVNGNSTKVDAYRAAIRSYRTSESSANDVIGTIHSLLENQLDVTGRIVTDTADLLDSEEKRRALLDSWDEYSRTATSIVDAFPSLVPTAPVATQSGSRFTAARQARTFMPRSAKQTSSAVWDRVAEAAANKNVGSVPGLTRAAQQSKEKFPALPSAAHAVSKTAGPRGATPWASHKSQTTLPASTYFPVASSASIALMPSGQKSAAGSRPASRSTTSSAREFPDLPQAAPPKARAYFSRSGEATPNRWADGSISPSAELAEAIQRSLDDVQISNTQQTSNSTEASQPSGKKKKGKQLLFQYGL